MPLRICQVLMLLLASDSDPDIVGPGEDRVDRVDAMAGCGLFLVVIASANRLTAAGSLKR